LFLSVLWLLTVPTSAFASFGINSFTVTARDSDGTIDERPASHPFTLEVRLALNTDQEEEPEGVLREVQIDLPPGMIGNALAIPRCALGDFEHGPPHCKGATQIGVLHAVIAGLGLLNTPIYNVAPSPGYAAAFGASLFEGSFVQQLRLSNAGAGSSIRLSGTLPPDQPLVEAEEEIWGVPASPAHDQQRTCWIEGEEFLHGCPAGSTEQALLTLPGSCVAPLRTTLTATSLGPPQETALATAFSRDAGGNPQPLVGCESVPFDPRLTTSTDGAALVPTGLVVGVEVPQHAGVGVTASAMLAGLRLELPQGLALNPSAGPTLGECSPDEIGLQSAPGVQPPVFGEVSSACPPASRIGSVQLRSPLIEHPLVGSIYFATPGANPSSARYAFYLLIEDEETGTVLKVPGRLEADSETGRLTALIPELPQLPFEDLELEFGGGPRAPLVSPAECGRYTTEATFTPSTAPFGSAVDRSAALTLDRGSGGGPCPPAEVERNARPSFQAGTMSSVAGAEAPFVVELSRADPDQHFGAFELTLPPGLIANLGSVPVGTEVGSARVEAGAGPEPLDLDGKVYLEGPYKAAPYSLTIVVPAQAGPFDLGTIVERIAVDVDPAIAQVSVRSDPLPQILAGVPLQLRGLRIDLDRPGFIRNPTSCEPMTIAGTTTTSLGQTAPISSRFQVGECAMLFFAPRLSVTLSGALGANGHPALRATLRTDPSGAALKSAAFMLPAGELLDLRHVRGLCPWAEPVGRCPRNSRLGSLRLQSPFLDAPLEGPVYLRVPSHRLPDLSAELSSGALSFVLPGRTTGSGGKFGVSLESLPDIPLSSAVLSLAGGRRGILVNSRSLCRKRGRVRADLSAHNGMRRKLRVPVGVDGCQ
jgi:hypothetical protein